MASTMQQQSPALGNYNHLELVASATRGRIAELNGKGSTGAVEVRLSEVFGPNLRDDLRRLFQASGALPSDARFETGKTPFHVRVSWSGFCGHDGF